MEYYACRPDELMHHGVKGMKWGVHRYRSNSVRAYAARKANEQVDKSFKKWKAEDDKKKKAIDLGLKANASKLKYERDGGKENYKQYHQDLKAYKTALRENTTYRKGSIREQVGKDISRKHLSEAKKIKKLLDVDPSNKKLKKQYDKYMSEHDVERAKARRAQAVGAKRSRRIASVKRSMTMGVKTAATAAVVGIGLNYMKKHVSGFENMNVNAASVINAAEKARRFMQYVY